MLFITIDGPSASGKGTIARYLSREFNLKHMDSGLCYRCLGFAVFETNTPTDSLEALEQRVAQYEFSSFYEPRLRDEDIAHITSQISIHPFVRHKVNAYLHDVWKNLTHPPYHGMIVDGRDMGTVVFPKADIKLFVVADEKIRSQRRFLEQSHQEQEVIQTLVLKRDQHDEQRSIAPLQPAKDAIILDTSELSIGQACEKALQIVELQKKKIFGT